MSEPSRTIVIRQNGDRFAVTVEPSPFPDVDFSGEYDTHKSAHSFAITVGLLRRVGVVDETNGGEA